MGNIVSSERNDDFLSEICSIIRQGRENSGIAVNRIMIDSYWLLGKRIVNEEQNGENRAQYGKQILKIASDELTKRFGKGFGIRNISYFRQFYLLFPDLEILHTRVQNLSWSHIRTVLRVDDENIRNWYLAEASREGWGVRLLNRNIATQYYQRLLLSHSQQAKNIVHQEMISKAPVDVSTQKLEFFKNPLVAEFLGISQDFAYSETALETAIINHLGKFLMELGKGFAFVARQQRINTDMGDYYIDLVFYNYILKCFVLVDLKTDAISHQDVGQMDMYIRMYDELKKRPEDNPTIGLILCSETSRDIARYSILNGNQQLFASKYLPYLPTIEELQKEIENQKEIFQLQFEKTEESDIT
ncbi:MAG: DUF1016 family protein [Thermoguttaceae bacterium]|nr:DUF1016 family protein [Thermoguttaceae bacterium]